MPSLAAPGLVAAVLLALAGGQKLVDPAMTVGALRSLRLPSSNALVRAGSAAELSLGVAALAVGGVLLWALVALSYLAFGAFVVAALRSGTMIGSCGCFGREETPPHWSHVALNAALAAVAAGAGVTVDGALVDVLIDEPGRGVVVVGLAALGTYLAYAVFVELPRTLATAKSLRA